MTTLYYRIDGQRLAQARRDAFMTQQQLSDLSGISLASIQAIEQPRRSKAYTAGQRPYTVVALANAVGITPSDLLCTTSPQGKSVGKTVGKSPDKTLGKKPVEAASQARDEHVMGGRGGAFDLGVDLEPQVLALVSQDQEPTPPYVPPLTAFADFWAAYPRKQGKIAAEKAYRTARKKADHDAIMAGLARFVADPNRTDEFTPYPATWLNRGQWDDDPLPERNGQGGTDLDRWMREARRG